MKFIWDFDPKESLWGHIQDTVWCKQHSYFALMLILVHKDIIVSASYSVARVFGKLCPLTLRVDKSWIVNPALHTAIYIMVCIFQVFSWIAYNHKYNGAKVIMCAIKMGPGSKF